MSDNTTANDRPRRSTRAPVRYTMASASRSSQPQPQPQPQRTTRNADAAEQKTDQLQTLLTNPKSALTTMDISDILNSTTWSLLPLESRDRLCALLPPTAFGGFIPSLHPSHPSRTSTVSRDDQEEDAEMLTENMIVDTSSDALDTSIFSDAHFLAAAHTFQDHIFTGWMTDAHKETVQKYESGIRDGTLHAPWKDEVWERDHPPPVDAAVGGQPATLSQQSESSARAGDAAELKLVDLAKNSVIRVGDVLAYKRNFSQLGLTVEKDVIIESIHPKTHAITILIEPSTTLSLPPELLAVTPAEPDAPTKTMVINSPTMLENGVLDVDGRVERTKRPNGNAWKSLTVWRWRQEPTGDVDMLAFQERGGRENHGTLFYLRGCFYHDR